MANVSLLLRLENVGSGRCSFREGFSDLILLPAIDVPKEKALQRTYCSLAGAFPLHCSGLFLFFFPETNRWTSCCSASAAVLTASRTGRFTVQNVPPSPMSPANTRPRSRTGFTTNSEMALDEHAVIFNSMRRYRITHSQTNTPSKNATVVKFLHRFDVQVKEETFRSVCNKRRWGLQREPRCAPPSWSRSRK